MGIKSDIGAFTAPETVAMLQKSNNRLASTSLGDLLNSPNRFARFSRRAGPLLLDYSRVRFDEATLEQLLDAGRASGIESHRASLFAGADVNVTEHRPALHMALRSPDLLERIGGDEAQKVSAAMAKMIMMK